MKTTTIFAVACLAAVMGGCGGGGGGSSGGQQIPSTPPAFTTLTGTWNVAETLNDNCPDVDFQSYSMSSIQNGSAIQVTDGQGRNYNGTMAGNQIFPQVPFSYPEDGGMTTVTQLSITAVSEVELQGNSVWSWSDGVDACSGTSTFSAFKQP